MGRPADDDIADDFDSSWLVELEGGQAQVVTYADHVWVLRND